MIDISKFIDITLARLKTLENNKGISLLTFKKDRKITILKNNNTFSVYEDGFFNESFHELDNNSLRKLLKSLSKKEFPRSHKLHLEVINKHNFM